MIKIAHTMTDLIGNTPLLALENYTRIHNVSATIIAKLEYFNPSGSAKDRIAYAMIADAEEKGILKPGGTIIEPTSGNTGIGLAAVAAAKGYRAILVMPDTMSVERRNMIGAYGAEIVLTPGKLGMQGTLDKAAELAKEIPNSFIPSQFDNPANPEIHYRTTGPEVWNDTEGNVDAFVAGIGTGGTLSGTSKYLKEHKPEIVTVGVEPDASPLITKGQAGPHKLQGIGANFVPKNYKSEYVDEVLTVSAEEAFAACHDLAKTEGILVGITSGAALAAAVRLSHRPEMAGKTIVALLPDSGNRYLSTPVFIE